MINSNELVIWHYKWTTYILGYLVEHLILFNSKPWWCNKFYRSKFYTFSQHIDTVTGAESRDGSTEYRWLFVRNNHATDGATAVKVYLSDNTGQDGTESDSDVAITYGKIGSKGN